MFKYVTNTKEDSNKITCVYRHLVYKNHSIFSGDTNINCIPMSNSISYSSTLTHFSSNNLLECANLMETCHYQFSEIHLDFLNLVL